MPEQTGRQVAIVVGGSGGIGRAVAEKLAAEGMDVIVHYHQSKQKVQEIVKQIQESGGTAMALAADITQFSQVENLVEQTVKHFQRVDVLAVCSGGHDIPDEMRGLPSKERFIFWNHLIEKNLSGPIFCAYAVCPQMIKQNYGRIILTSSTAKNGIQQASDYVDVLHRCGYAASKEGLVGITRTLANYLAGNNITVNCVVPGPIHEPSAQVSPVKKRKLSLIPMKRAGTPKDVAEAISFLASPNSGISTGNIFYVSGGFLGMGINPELVDWLADGKSILEV